MVKIFFMKRIPKLFKLLSLLTEEEKKILISEFMDYDDPRIANYMLTLLRADSLKDIYKLETEWKSKHKSSLNTLWHIRNQAYWIVIDTIDKYGGYSNYIGKIMRLYRVDMHLTKRKNGKITLQNIHRSLSPDSKELWFFYPSTWWYECALSIYAYGNHSFLEHTIVDDIVDVIRYSHSAFKILSAFRSANLLKQNRSEEVQAIVQQINLTSKENAVAHHETILFFLASLLFFSQVGFFDSYTRLMEVVAEWDPILHKLSYIVRQNHNLPRTELITLITPWQKVREVIYSFPPITIFNKDFIILKRIAKEPTLFDNLENIVRIAWWAVMNGKLDIGSILLEKASKNILSDRWSPVLREIFFISMAWLYFVRYRNKQKVKSHIMQIRSRQKSTYNIMNNLYNMLFALEDENWQEVRRAAEALYRFAHRNKIFDAAARVIRWLGRNLNESNKATIWETFKIKLVGAYKEQPWNIHLEAIIPLRIYTEAKIRNTALTFIDYRSSETRWLTPYELQQRVEDIYMAFPDTDLIVSKARHISGCLLNWLNK